MADAMLDRLMQNHHRFTLTGESLRKKSPPAKGNTDNQSTTIRGGPPAAWQGPINSKTIQFQIGKNSRKSKPA